MNKFAKGLIAGGVLGIAGVTTMAMTDKKFRKRAVKNSVKAMKKKDNMIDNIANII